MILVTGGAGFIGSNLVAALAERGEEVVVVDRLRSGSKWRNLAKHEIAGLVDPSHLLPWLKESSGRRIRAVLHMGAISSTTESDVDLIAENNIRLTLALWEWCTREEVPFLYASSAATYGDGAQGFDDDPSPEVMGELRPLNPYGWSKLVVDRRIARIVANGGETPPQWAGLRFFNVYGPNEYHKGPMRSVVEQAWGRISRGEPVRLFRSHRAEIPDGGQQRDFVYVGDCVAMVLWLLDQGGVSGIFNCGTGVARSFLELVTAAFQVAGRPLEVEWMDTPEALRERYQYFTEARMERIRAAGFQRPPTALEAGVAAYLEGFLMREDPYR